jgi:GNAT superfamily N-acetyltransferase
MADDEVVVRALTPADVARAFALSSSAGWNQRVEDWQMLLRLAPAGSFAAVTTHDLVGTAIGIDYGAFGWIAMMLVDPAWRGRGVGARLLESAMAALPSGNPIRLDATPLGRPLYERYGFVEETRLTRYVRDARAWQATGSNTATRTLSADDLDTVVPLDCAVFGGDRRRVFDWMLRDAPDYAHIAQGSSVDYCFGRRGRLFDQIGPVVADHVHTAQALTAAALAAARERAVQLDAFDAQPEFGRWLVEQGFRNYRPLFRMRRGDISRPPDLRGDGPVEVAILGPEFA